MTYGVERGLRNSRLKTGGLALDGMNCQAVWDDVAVWKKALRKLRGHLIPPPGLPQPPQKDADEIVAWLESTLDSHPAAQTLLAKAPATR